MTTAMHTFAEVDVPWYMRVPIATALGALVGMIADTVARTASTTALLLAISPAIAAVNTIVGDLGRRRFSIIATFGSGIVAVLLVPHPIGAAIVAVALGGVIGARLVGPGRHRETRQGVLFVLGAAFCPLAILAAYSVMKRLGPSEALSLRIAIFQTLFWLPLAGAEAALGWSAARARRRRRIQSEADPPS